MLDREHLLALISTSPSTDHLKHSEFGLYVFEGGTSTRHEGGDVLTFPVLSPSGSQPDVSGPDSHSARLVLEQIKKAPVAYFRFISVVAFLGFVFSLVFYLAFKTILFNPLFAVFGALGSLLTVLLVEASVRLEKRNSQRQK